MTKKRFFFLFLCLGLLISSAIPAYADKNEEKDKKEVYSYKYKNIEFEGNVPLAEGQLEEMYQSLKKDEENNKIIPPAEGELITYQLPGEPGSSYVVYGPIYKTYDNAMVYITATAIVGWIASKVPYSFSSSFATTWTVSALTYFAFSERYQYVKAHVWRSYDNYYDCYSDYETIVHYYDSGFTKTKKVQYYRIKACAYY